MKCWEGFPQGLSLSSWGRTSPAGSYRIVSTR
jgi:hypothetical protein